MEIVDNLQIMVIQILGMLHSGMRKVSLENDEHRVTGYYIGDSIRLDIIPK